MKTYKSTDVGMVMQLDADDKMRYGTEWDFFISNGHYTISGNNPLALEAEMKRVLSIKRTIIY